jgi:hypothetical protein
VVGVGSKLVHAGAWERQGAAGVATRIGDLAKLGAEAAELRLRTRLKPAKDMELWPERGKKSDHSED